MASIEAPTGQRQSWSVRYWTLAGEQRRYGRIPDARTAKAIKREIETAHALGEEWIPRSEAGDPDLSEVMQAYLDDRARVLSRGSLEQVRVAFDQLREYLRARVQRRGRLRLSMLSKAVLSGYWAWLREPVEVDKRGNSIGGRGQSIKTANNRLNRIMGDKGLWRWADNHDFYEAYTPKPRTIELPSPKQLPPIQVTWAMTDAAIGAAAPWHSYSMSIARYTGLRGGQVMRLEWRDVDLQAATLVIRPELGKTQRERRGRIVPITPHLVELLAGMGRRDGYLVAPGRETRTTGYEAVRLAWIQSGAIPEEKLRQPMHLFRKAQIQGLLGLGVPEHVVKALVGHARGETDTYAPIATMMEPMREAVAQIPKIGSIPLLRLRRAE